MAGTPNDPWRTSTLQKLGAEIRALEEREHAAQESRRTRTPRRLLAAPVLALAAVVAAVVFFGSGGRARASSAVNRAPAAAIRSATVRFRSHIAVAVNGRPLRVFHQTGELNFRRREYRTVVEVSGSNPGLEWRATGGVLYLSTQPPAGSREPAQRIAVRLTDAQQASLGTVPEGDALTDPHALLRVLANVRAPATRVGASEIEGQPTTQYQLRSDLASVLHASSPDTRLPAAYRAVAATLSVWLDAEGRPRRVVERLSKPTASGVVELVNDTHFSGYGAAVTINPPRGVAVSRSLRGGLPLALVGTPTRVFESLVLARAGA
jgi:hypothetical protein